MQPSQSGDIFFCNVAVSVINDTIVETSFLRPSLWKCDRKHPFPPPSPPPPLPLLLVVIILSVYFVSSYVCLRGLVETMWCACILAT